MTDHPDGKTRCIWPTSDPLYVHYHDTEWGVPIRDDRALFEKLILDGFQAGLAWITILRKRENFIAAFDGFRPEVIAAYGPEKVEALMADTGIVRNRAKIEATVKNARGWLDIMEHGEGFSPLLWSFVGGAPLVNNRRGSAEIPAETPESRAMSKALRAHGFSFVGPTICYAFMQAVGMVNDHTTDCFRHDEV
jgi:DNA-3-methyladenine glycosylase I